MLADSHTPIFVPVLFTVWGVLLWFVWGRRMVRDPRAELRHMAEVQLKWGTGIGKDVETQFKWLWRLRWIFALVAVVWVAGTIGAWAAALSGH